VIVSAACSQHLTDGLLLARDVVRHLEHDALVQRGTVHSTDTHYHLKQYDSMTPRANVLKPMIFGECSKITYEITVSLLYQ